MAPRRTSVEHSKGVFNVEWPLFGELSRVPFGAGSRAQVCLCRRAHEQY